MSETTTALLVRHGETAWNRQDRIQGWAPSELTERGREQARAVGRHVAETYGVDRVVASDLRRTRETVALLREAGIAAEPTFERAWRERDFGVLQGLTKDEIFEGFPQYAVESGVFTVRERPERGETLLEVRERVLAGWERVRASEADTVLVVTHGGPLALLFGAIRSQDIVTAVTENSQDNCALNELRVGETVEIVRYNETVHED